MLYDHQPGDEYQVHDYCQYTMSVPPEWEWSSYHHYTCLSRTETADSLVYQFRRHTIVVDSSLEYTDTVQISYFKAAWVSEIPYEKFDGSTRNFALNNYGGQNFWTSDTYKMQGWAYCPPDKCWGFDDTGGPPEVWDTRYAAGIGKLMDWNYISGPQGFSKGKIIIYFKKNGFIWGDLVVGMSEHEDLNQDVFVTPIPAKDNLTIKTHTPVKSVSIFDICGSLHLFQPAGGNECSIDITSFKPGIYFVSVILENNSPVTKKVVVGN